ncbi:hypothetical protein EUGRSUZ_E02978 [Eucalyptus grandis]|uniref:Uncharacterized protein n=2 Tax=Eucalyptus grandis TaxID=71139 RepID=A0ACC3KXT6_EUCGR|nr:hypothetical protein EUGRSUZ_E02978 [Eucalyptus grandis]
MSSEKHVAVLVFPFTCHHLPLANLVRKLAETVTNVHFSFLSTAMSNRDLFPPSSRAELPPNIVVYDINNGVPAGHHGATTDELIEQMNMFLKQAPKSFRAAIDATERDARKKRPTTRPWKWLSLFCISDIPDNILQDPTTSPVSNFVHQLVRMLSCATAVIMKSYVEAIPSPLTADLKSKFKILLHVGHILSTTSSDSNPTGCLMWLDTKNPRTVAYVCFGMIAVPSPTKLSTLAEALESTGTPFLWSIKEHMMVHLPEGFLERTGQCGKIVSWASQSRVLSHLACGVHMTHCGYNSVFESVAGGVPMICKPLSADKMMNGRLDGMVKALEVVLRSDAGEEMRKKVGELRERLVDASGPGGSVQADFKILVKLIST